MHIGHAGDGRAGEVHRHGDTIFLNGVADFLGFEDASRGRQIGMQNIDGVILRQFDKVFLQIKYPRR